MCQKYIFLFVTILYLHTNILQVFTALLSLLGMFSTAIVVSIFYAVCAKQLFIILGTKAETEKNIKRTTRNMQLGTNEI